jgi:hypothetical protein
MPTITKGATVTGSGERFTLTDLTPGRVRTQYDPHTGATLVAWLIPAALGLVAGAIWGKNSQPNEDLAAAKGRQLEAIISKDNAAADKAEAEATAISAGIENPAGLSRQVAEDLAKRRVGLDERNADLVQQAYQEEGDFRRTQREAQTAINAAKVRSVNSEATIREAQAETAFQQSLTAAERAKLDTDKLALSNQRDEEQLTIIRTLREQLQEQTRRIPTTAPEIGIRAIGPGVGGPGLVAGPIFK